MELTDIQRKRLVRNQGRRNVKNSEMVDREIHELRVEAFSRKCNLLVISDEKHGKYTTLYYGGMFGSHGTDILNYSSLIRERDFRFIEVLIVNGMKRIFDHGYMNLDTLFQNFPKYKGT